MWAWRLSLHNDIFGYLPGNLFQASCGFWLWESKGWEKVLVSSAPCNTEVTGTHRTLLLEKANSQVCVHTVSHWTLVLVENTLNLVASGKFKHINIFMKTSETSLISKV